MKVKTKCWLEDDKGEAVFGEGRRKILQLIDELGSMQSAAKALGMSYRGVWARIKATEERIGVKLLETSVGRGKDRGSRLTPEAKKLLENFHRFHQESMTACDALYEQIFSGLDPEMTPAVPTVAVVGPKGVGRTGLIRKMIAEWQRRGKRVGLMEQNEEDQPETPPEDQEATGRPRAAISFGTDRLEIRMDRPLDTTPEILAANYALDCDLVLYKTSDRLHIPSIEVWRRDISPKRIVRKRKDLIAILGDAPEDKDAELAMDLDDIPALIDRTEQKMGIQTPPEVSLMVNGHRVPLLPFVEDLIANTFQGLVTSLKGCQSAETIDLLVRRK